MAEILQYVPGDGIFHRLHPVTKILFIIIVSVVTILTSSIPLLAGLLLLIFLLAFAGHLLRPVIQQMILILLMSIVIYLITILTVQDGAVIGYLVPSFIPLIGGSIPITVGALTVGTVLTLRFAILISAFQLFVISTQPRDLVHTMERARVPVDYTLMFIIALRFIPTLQIEGKRIHEAQLARGYHPGDGFMGRIRSVAPVMVPLVSNSLSRATLLGLTIDLRGYRTRARTRLRERTFGIADKVAIPLMCLAGIAFLYGFLTSSLL
ncbi:MAG TPA: energy-coupling factor transporter transmembrane component T, partial [Methanoregulaceae archaeon]|nr:energy-coupling factor transporter transmembrane component T [Methanoregulaceae archaeon]HNL86514.1 energy-coupling factor transporter transmembrane component T [Methanoregulaceae archaeon]HNO07652.1 energy-coupling factor transporter transmembrane component T [Methanoregulaceae archaeon]